MQLSQEVAMCIGLGLPDLKRAPQMVNVRGDEFRQLQRLCLITTSYKLTRQPQCSTKPIPPLQYLAKSQKSLVRGINPPFILSADSF